MADLKLADIAKRICAHLQRFERDPKINPPCNGGLRYYYYANAWRAGSRVGVRYVSFQGISNLPRAKALEYLAWLDAGNVGSHYEQQRAARPEERK